MASVRRLVARRKLAQNEYFKKALRKIVHDTQHSFTNPIAVSSAPKYRRGTTKKIGRLAMRDEKERHVDKEWLHKNNGLTLGRV